MWKALKAAYIPPLKILLLIQVWERSARWDCLISSRLLTLQTRGEFLCSRLREKKMDWLLFPFSFSIFCIWSHVVRSWSVRLFCRYVNMVVPPGCMRRVHLQFDARAVYKKSKSTNFKITILQAARHTPALLASWVLSGICTSRSFSWRK